MKRIILIFVSIFGLVVISFFVWRLEYSDISVAEKCYIDEQLKDLRKEDRKKLEYVFEYLFFFDQFGFTLYGSKPMCMARLIPKNEFLEGWEIWKRIAPRFETEDFVLGEFLYNDHLFVLFANMSLVEEIYNQNKMIFQEEFNGRVTLESLKNSLRFRDRLFYELLDNHLTAGILFGYGESNARLFNKRERLPEDSRQPMTFFSEAHPIFYYLLNDVYPPCFACDPASIETKQLRTRYKKERLKLRKLGRSTLFKRMLLRFKRL